MMIHSHNTAITDSTMMHVIGLWQCAYFTISISFSILKMGAKNFLDNKRN